MIRSKRLSVIPVSCRRWRNDPHAMDEIRKAWIHAQGIEPGSPREPEQVSIPEPVSGFEPGERRSHIAESSVNDCQGGRRRLTSSAELLELLEKTPGFICPAEPAVDMSKVGER